MVVEPGITSGPRRCDASAPKGGIIQATHVVFCTGYEFLDAVANQGHRNVSTWAFATRPHHPRPKWLTDYLVWEGSDPYLYFRSTPDGRIIVGGEDEDNATSFQDPVKLGAKSRTLRKKLSALLNIPIEEPDYQWAAAFGTTADGLPMIGAVPGFNQVYAAMGYGGNGITFSQIAAEILSAEILGHQEPDGELFAFRCPSKRSAPFPAPKPRAQNPSRCTNRSRSRNPAYAKTVLPA